MLALAALLLCAAPAPAVPAPVLARAAQLRDEALKGTRATEVVRSLTDEVGPRLAGSTSYQAAVKWALARLTASGLKSARAEPVKTTRWVRGEERGEIVAPYPQRLVLTALGGSAGTAPEGVTAPVVQTEDVASLEALLKASPEAVRGKLVFFNRRMRRTQGIEGYAEAVTIRSRGALAAARGGALAVLVRSVGTNTTRLPHTGGVHYEEGLPRLPAAALAPADADLLERLAQAGKAPVVKLVLGAHVEGEAEEANAVAELPGRERPAEVVLLGAHLDSWDLGPGALDDGAGVAVMVEVARRLAALPVRPRRTIRVVLFANEENGATGAKAYAAQHAAELGQHVAALEADLGQGAPFGMGLVVGPQAEPALGALGGLLRPLEVDPARRGPEAGVDVSYLTEAGVPQLGLDQDASGYFDVHHSADDTFEQIEPAALDRLVAGYLAMAYTLAEMPGDLGRVPPKPK